MCTLLLKTLEGVVNVQSENWIGGWLGQVKTFHLLQVVKTLKSQMGQTGNCTNCKIYLYDFVKNTI